MQVIAFCFYLCCTQCTNFLGTVVALNSGQKFSFHMCIYVNHIFPISDSAPSVFHYFHMTESTWYLFVVSSLCCQILEFRGPASTVPVPSAVGASVALDKVCAAMANMEEPVRHTQVDIHAHAHTHTVIRHS